ncbi:Ku protein [Streptomyces sp. NPDC004286]|uniref:non-homologous end joining protein Ku n=1 Tax=Streptomyces sp. NPDC004286 TaxID=3364696 RepID=UPI0036CF81FB
MPQTASPGSTVWSGAISFGLVTVPVRVVSATQDRSVHLRQIHTADGGRVRYRKVCELEDREVHGAEIGRAYEMADGSLVPVTDQDLRDLPLPTARAIEIVAFLPTSAVDPIRLGGAGYYLAADGSTAAKPYTLLRKALARSTRVAVARFAWHGQERLGLLRTRDDAIVLHPLYWDDEIRTPTPEMAPAAVAVAPEEIDGALGLVEAMTRADLKGADLRDTYREAVQQVIEAKQQDRPAPGGPSAAPSGPVLDLMAALSESVDRAREARGEATVHDLPTRQKKAAAKKAAPKKVAARRRA